MAEAGKEKEGAEQAAAAEGGQTTGGEQAAVEGEEVITLKDTSLAGGASIMEKKSLRFPVFILLPAVVLLLLYFLVQTRMCPQLRTTMDSLSGSGVDISQAGPASLVIGILSKICGF